MSDEHDAVDQIWEQLAELYPRLDPSGVAITGRVLRLAAAIEAWRAEHLTQFGLAPAEFDVLATIRRTQGEAGVNPRLLMRWVMISSGGMTKRLDRLEQAGCIARHPDPNDRRGVLIRLTEHGHRVIDRALVSLVTAEQQLVAERLTTSQQEHTVAALRRLATLLPPARPT